MFLAHKSTGLQNGRSPEEEEDDVSIVKGQSPLRADTVMSMQRKRLSDSPQVPSGMQSPNNTFNSRSNSELSMQF